MLPCRNLLLPHLDVGALEVVASRPERDKQVRVPAESALALQVQGRLVRVPVELAVSLQVQGRQVLAPVDSVVQWGAVLLVWSPEAPPGLELIQVVRERFHPMRLLWRGTFEPFPNHLHFQALEQVLAS